MKEDKQNSVQTELFPFKRWILISRVTYLRTQLLHFLSYRFGKLLSASRANEPIPLDGPTFPIVK